MAVKAPNPPTPPMPPAVPGVTLSEGGSVTQSNAPPAKGTTSRSTDNEKQMEEQAKEAVVNGSGGLSRTTQKNPAAEAKAAREAAREAGQAGAKQAKETADTGRNQAAQAARLDSTMPEQQYGDQKAKHEQEGVTGTLQTEPSSMAIPYQGPVCWGTLLVLFFLIGSLLVKKFLHRHGHEGELAKSELDENIQDASAYNEFRGLTPDEIMKRLENNAPKAEDLHLNKSEKGAQKRKKSNEDEHKHFEVSI